ncbi:MAG: ABC transporter permease [Clostridia bacterium]
METKRSNRSGSNGALIASLVAILMGLIAGSILMLVSGMDPIKGYGFLFKGGLMSVSRIANTIAYSAPLILTGLSLVLSFRTGLFNIGASGQMLMGGLAALAVGNWLAPTGMSKAILLPIVLMSSMLGGATWGFISGILKAKFNVNEVVSCIMLNWCAYWIVYNTVFDHFKSATIDSQSVSFPAAANLKVEALTKATGGSQLNLGILIAILAAVAILFILEKTILGYEMKAVGFNKYAAECNGINVEGNVIKSMTISGLLAGLAGAACYAGYNTNMQIGVLPSQGFDGIAVAILAGNSPIGTIFAALFLSVLHTGKGFMNSMAGIPPEIADAIIAIIIYFSATSKLIQTNFERIRKWWQRRRTRKVGK